MVPQLNVTVIFSVDFFRLSSMEISGWGEGDLNPLEFHTPEVKKKKKKPKEIKFVKGNCYSVYF